jgi:hypothetical protein
MKAHIKKTFKKNWYYIVIASLAIILISTITFSFITISQKNTVINQNNTTGNSEPADIDSIIKEHNITLLDTTQASNDQETTQNLLYLIEEEKLAHDVYQVLYEKWGLRTFNNIKNSESTHQQMVLAVMESRGIVDPRKSEIGKFTNPELQTLYDSLIAKGSQSQTEAYKVGVAIEELDINDLKRMIDNLDPKDTDISGVFESLLNGSENHLRAFNRKL